MDPQVGVLPETIGVQIVGFITLGQPLIPNPKEEVIAVPATDLPAGKNIYCLRVRGQGLQNEGLFDGDYLLIEQVSEVSDGSVAVALLNNGTAVIKKVYEEETRTRLMPLANDTTPLFVKKTRIQGRVLMVIRKLQ
jgi:repressor LexA